MLVFMHDDMCKILAIIETQDNCTTGHSLLSVNSYVVACEMKCKRPKKIPK